MRNRRPSLFVLLVLMVLSSAHGLASFGDLRLEGGPFLPYRIATARIGNEGGREGTIRLLGLPWEGKPRLLFETTVDAYAEIVEAAFYIDEELRALVVERVSRGEVERGPETPLLRREGESPEEARLSAEMRAFPFPLVETSRGDPPASFALAEDSLESAARKAAGRLFVLPGPGRSILVVLGAFALASVLLGRLRFPKRRTELVLALIFSLAAAGLVVIFLPQQALLYTVALPSADPAARLSGSLVGRNEGGQGWRGRAYGENGEIDFMGILAPRDRRLPLELIAAPDLRFRFDRAPRMILDRGKLWIETDGLTLVWRLHDRS